jgi:antirestriction protein
MANIAKPCRVYVGTYKKYANGNIKGAWLTLSEYDSKESFIEACHKLHEDEDAPELMFQDWDSIPDNYINESFISEELWDAMEEIDDDKWNAFLDFADAILEGDIQSTLVESFNDMYRGEYDTLGDFAIKEIAPNINVHDDVSFSEFYESLPYPLSDSVHVDWEEMARSYGAFIVNGIVYCDKF